MGAWIETKTLSPMIIRYQSRPSWARGLKHTSLELLALAGLVAPFMGAWIETEDTRKA